MSSAPDFQFHHVGVVTRGMNTCRKFYEDLRYEASETFRDPHQKAEILLMTRADSPMVELISPMSEDSPAMGWAKRLEAGPYHTCYEVDDLEESLQWLAAQRLQAVMDPVPAIAFNMRRVTFVFGRRTGLMELLEKTR